jgi:hypothetical protein
MRRAGQPSCSQGLLNKASVSKIEILVYFREPIPHYPMGPIDPGRATNDNQVLIVAF